MRRLLVLPLLASLFLVACGDDADALSKDEYIEQGDARCAELNEFSEGLGEPESEEELVSYLEEVETEFRSFREDFFALTPPEDAEDLHEQFRDVVDESLDIVQESIRLAEDGDIEGAAEELTSMDEAAGDINADLEEYGFSDCAEE